MSADIVRPTEVPRKIVTMFMSSLEEVFTRRSTTPASLKMLPSMSMMIRAEASGTTRMQTIITITANTMRSALETGRRAFMRILRSLSLVIRRMIGGWMSGTSAM